MSSHEPSRSLEDNIAGHIFSVSAGMVGVCLTVIGLFKISDRLRNLSGIGDELLALDAAAFLLSCVLAYLALRSRPNGRKHRLEWIADRVFLGGLAMMVVVCALIAYELI